MKGYIKALWAQKAQDEISRLRSENEDKDEEISRLQSLIVSTQCQWTDEVQKLEYDNKELSLQRIDLWSELGELEEKNAELRKLVEEAYRDGYEEGRDAATNWEWGCYSSPLSVVWKKWAEDQPILKEQP